MKKKEKITKDHALGYLQPMEGKSGAHEEGRKGLVGNLGRSGSCWE